MEENEIRYKIITNRGYWEGGTKEENINSAIRELKNKISFIQSQSQQIESLTKENQKVFSEKELLRIQLEDNIKDMPERVRLKAELKKANEIIEKTNNLLHECNSNDANVDRAIELTNQTKQQ